jgi:hypothetical protein
LPFVQNEDLLSTGKQWEEWIEGIEREFRYFRITEPIDKKDALLIYGGKEIVRLNKSLKNERVLSYFVPSQISFSILLPIFNFFCLEHQFYPRRQ